MELDTNISLSSENPIGLKEALFYSSSKGYVHCGLCPHNCTLKDREVGLCRTRVNIKGKLYTLAYANPCAVNVDPIEKKPL
ncbi:MAG: hypothetical protein N2662_08310, partial [Bacteroidales bacterium]|nr:hypothetical protein [Bacteroidales bacterium]